MLELIYLNIFTINDHFSGLAMNSIIFFRNCSIVFLFIIKSPAYYFMIFEKLKQDNLISAALTTLEMYDHLKLLIKI